jgi:hypothetical protein
MTQALTVGATNLIRLRRLRYEVTGAYISTATVSCTLKDSTGATVAGPISMSYVAGSVLSRGEYQGTLSEATPLTVGATYDAEITAVAPDGSERVFHLECVGVEG